MTFFDVPAVFKGYQKEDRCLVFDAENMGLLVTDPLVMKTAFILPYLKESKVLLRLTVSNRKAYIQDIGFPGLGCEEIELCLVSQKKYPNTCQSDFLVADSHSHGLFVCKRQLLGDKVFGLLQAGHTVKITANGKQSRFSLDNYALSLPKTVSGTLSYAKALHESQGSDCYVGTLLPDDDNIPAVPCVVKKTLLREHHIDSLAEGYVLEVDAALDTNNQNVVVSKIQQLEYPAEFETTLSDASLEQGKNKPFLCASFSYHPGVYARINIFQSILTVVSVKKPVSLPVKIGYEPAEKYAFIFKDVAIPKGHNAQVTPTIVKPYPSEFTINVNGIVVNSFVSEKKWAECAKKEMNNRCRLPEFEQGKSYVLPVNAALYKQGGVKFFLADVGVDKVVEGSFKYLGLRNVLKFTYCEFSLPPSEVCYQVLLTEFLMYGIGGFEAGAQVKMQLVKSDKNIQGFRGSYVNKWVLDSLDIVYPNISTLSADVPVIAKSMFDWTLSSNIHTFDTEQWKQFSSQRENFAYLAITGFGPVLPALSVPPVLMRSNNVYNLQPGENLQVWVEKQAAMEGSLTSLENAHWLSALKVLEREKKERMRANIKRLKCTGFVDVEHLPENLGLVLEDEQGNKTTYYKFKKDKYPLSAHQLSKHIHIARCKADGDVIEILEIVNNEA